MFINKQLVIPKLMTANSKQKPVHSLLHISIPDSDNNKNKNPFRSKPTKKAFIFSRKKQHFSYVLLS
jgi:hypothetical protein